MKNNLIFFVDDDKIMLNLMEYTFKCREGFEVKSFLSGERCVDHLHLEPDLIVLDYHLGEEDGSTMSGLETLERLKKAKENISVIILSREKDKETIEKFMEQGAMRYVTKDDFFIDTLIEPVETYFAQYKE